MLSVWVNHYLTRSWKILQVFPNCWYKFLLPGETFILYIRQNNWPFWQIKVWISLEKQDTTRDLSLLNEKSWVWFLCANFKFWVRFGGKNGRGCQTGTKGSGASEPNSKIWSIGWIFWASCYFKIVFRNFLQTIFKTTFAFLSIFNKIFKISMN